MTEEPELFLQTPTPSESTLARVRTSSRTKLSNFHPLQIRDFSPRTTNLAQPDGQPDETQTYMFL